MNERIEKLARRLGERLLERKLKIATVESCTGGFISEAITRIPGSSSWFDRGFITYTNAAKQELVGVSGATLSANGAVSGEVAREMASGGVRFSRADLAISVTGIAGPDGGSKEKPVGTVWIAWADRDGNVIDQNFQFEGDRQAVREASVESALSGAIELVEARD